MKTWLDKFIREVRMRKAEKLINGGIVYDIGCDDGTFLRRIKNKIKEGKGFDKNTVGGKEDNLTLKNILIKDKIPASNESVDYITMLAVLEHLDNPEKILKECNRILKKDGMLILTTPHPRNKKVLDLLCKLGLVEWGKDEIEEHKEYFNKEKILEILDKSGFKKINHRLFEFGLNNFVVAQK